VGAGLKKETMCALRKKRWIVAFKGAGFANKAMILDIVVTLIVGRLLVVT